MSTANAPAPQPKTQKPLSMREMAHDFGLLFSIGNVLLVAGNLISMAIMGAASALIFASKLLPKKNPAHRTKFQSFIQNKANSQALNAVGLLLSGTIGLGLAGFGIAAFPFFAAIGFGLGHAVMAVGRYYRGYCLSKKQSPKKDYRKEYRPKSLVQHIGRFCYRQYPRLTPGLFGLGYVFIALIASGWTLKALACFSSMVGFYGSITKKDSFAYRMFASSGIFTTIAHVVKATGDLARGDLISAGQTIYQCSYTVLFSAGEYRLAQMTEKKPAQKRIFMPPTSVPREALSHKRRIGGLFFSVSCPAKKVAQLLFQRERRR